MKVKGGYQTDAVGPRPPVPMTVSGVKTLLSPAAPAHSRGKWSRWPGEGARKGELQEEIRISAITKPHPESDIPSSRAG
jgi:hypothetical protein